MSSIQVEGLNGRQRILADIMWAMDTPEQVNGFIDSLQGEHQTDARIVMSMMVWAMLDQVNDTDLAIVQLDRISRL